MTVRHHVVATAGHIDHGKSALVRALTGTDPDRLPEEKARGITIDLGFAELTLTAPDGNVIHAGIIDVPGHEAFVRNMIAGVGSVDLALFVVAADDGWMPQTEEHLQILTYLGVRRAVVAVTKADLGGVIEKMTQIRKKLSETPFAEAPLVAVSARDSVGLDELKIALTAELLRCQPGRDIGKPRLFVDRAFSLAGIGSVVTGTLSGGQFCRDDALIVEPGSQRTRIRSLQNHGRAIEVAMPGMRTAVNLAGLSLNSSTNGVRRGDVLTGQAFELSRTLDVLFERSRRPLNANRLEPPLSTDASIYLHHGTSRTKAKLVLLESTTIAPGEQEVAQLRLATPILAFHGDRFVIRDRSERRTLGGGIVLDPKGRSKAFRSSAQKELLRNRAAAPDDLTVAIKTELARYGPAYAETLLQQSRFSAEEVASALKDLEQTEIVVTRDGIVAEAGIWRSLIARASELIDTAHARNSEKPGLELDRLRIALDQSESIFKSLVADLVQGDFVRERTFIARRSHKATLSTETEGPANEILKMLATKPFDPPAAKHLAADRKAREALNFLIQQKRVVELAPGVVLLQTSFEEMKAIVRQTIAQSGPATVSALRERLQSSRRVIVPFLEKLDRDGITRRQGDRRVLTKN